MLGSIWNFIKRHRRKFIFAGAIAGGGYILIKYARSRFQEFQDKEAEECLAFARKQHHFDSNQRTCNMTVLSMLPTLREAILQNLDTEALTAQLKSKPSNKLEIWETLKIMSVTRSVVALYTCCLVIVVLRVQLNIIGGYIFLDSQTSRNIQMGSPVATSEIQHRYLEQIHYIIGPGLVKLIAVTKAAVTEVLGDVALKQQVTLSDMQDILNKVRDRVENRNTNGSPFTAPSSLCQFAMAEDTELSGACSFSQEEIILMKLQQETRDMIESKDFVHVLNVCLDTAFTRLVDRIAEFFRCPPETDSDKLILNPNDICMPLAKVIPIINGLIHTICGDAPNQFIQELMLNNQVKDFAANVYEAFSQSDMNLRS